ncbi:hypothetical protein So717_19630 [Roseobacter cerasinus]|uniref:Uncharacterized protein n=1 Tax=Roseobacter cerasinus TaxID=2602289 RepID=A0A640VS08_9RHOB|nr:hypothetical protein So717_19630 [Roseobacter cerasinus]
MEWAVDAPQEIKLDGVSFAVQRITEDMIIDTINSIDTTWQVISRGPALLIKERGYVGSISPTDHRGAITVSLFRTPTKYVSYADAVARRRTLSGVCEGLF